MFWNKKIPKEWELAFKIGREKFYRFRQVQHLTTAGRYLYAELHLQMLALFNQTPADVQRWRAIFEEKMFVADGGTIDLGTAQVMWNEFWKQIHMTPSPEVVYNIAARVFFQPGDDLTDDIEPGELARRIALFKKKGLVELLSCGPMPTIVYSVTSLEPSFLKDLRDRLPVDKVMRESLMTWATLSPGTAKT